MLNKAGLDLIKSFEGCRLEAYKDIVGVLTVGWGHTGPDVYVGETWNQAQADAQLVKDLQRFEDGVVKLCKDRMPNPNQFAALVSFAYNLGLAALASSTLLRCFLKRNDPDAAKEFLKWNRAGGKVVAGLTRRREAESVLFTS